MTSSVATAVSSVAILNINLSIPDSVLSKLVASVAATTSAKMFASVVALPLAIGVIFYAKADGGVCSMASITVPILRLFFPSTFCVAEGSTFFCKSFVSLVLEDLAA
jgi:ABC-type proline/glycine betaine transport system permease subunit